MPLNQFFFNFFFLYSSLGWIKLSKNHSASVLITICFVLLSGSFQYDVIVYLVICFRFFLFLYKLLTFLCVHKEKVKIEILSCICIINWKPNRRTDHLEFCDYMNCCLVIMNILKLVLLYIFKFVLYCG